ncbi:MAG: DNA primase [Candidatus Gracilibacteria bacterium]
MADIVDDIKSRLSISDLVGQYVQLKKNGRNFKGLCPFHGEKTPSFIVSPEKQIFHCFGCSKGGDVFTFIQEIEGISFPEAIQVLADKVGLKVEDLSKFQKKEGKSEKDEYYKAHELAAEFFEKELHKSKDGKKVLDYLKKRGLNEETIEEFRLGYAPDSFEELYTMLLKKGISKNVLLRSGLAAQRNIGEDKIYDKFRGRLMFPIFDYLGKVCGFGGRALKADQEPKYLNSSENPIYSKGKVLYGFYHSKKFIKEEDKAIVVEGYFDVLLPYQNGVKNIVASSGTAFTPDQARLIKRLTENVVTAFDSDDAGFEATKRTYFILAGEGVNMKTVTGLSAKDPADYVLENREGFRNLINEAKNFVSFFIEKLVANVDTTQIDGRNKVIAEILPVYKEMPAITKDFYIRELAAKLKVQEQFVYDEIENFKLPTSHPAREASTAVAVGNGKFEVRELLLGLFLEYPSTYKEIADLISEADFESDWQKAIYNDLTDQYNSARNDFERWDNDSKVLAQEREKLNVLSLYVQEQYRLFSEDALTVEVGKLIDKMKKDRVARRLKQIENGIKEAEDEADKEKLIRLLTEQQTLLSK